MKTGEHHQPFECMRLLAAEWTDLPFMRAEFPMLTEWGVRDEGMQIHSLGCNYLAALGRECGHWAINEYSLFTEAGRAIRPDAIWWARPSGRPVFLAEFERYVPGQERKLADKAANLLESHHTLGRTADALLLLCWVMSGTDLSKARCSGNVMVDGLRAANGEWLAPVDAATRFMLRFVIMGSDGERLKVLRVTE